MDQSPEPMLRGGWARACGRAAAIAAGTAVLWLVVGVTAALGTWLWWLIAAVPIVVMIAVPFYLYWISEGRTWPSWVAFAFMCALLITAFAVPGDWYLRAYGEPVTATVGDSYCLEDREGDCLWNHTLYGPDGAELTGEFRDSEQHRAGGTLEVTTDPRGVFSPRPTVDLASRFFDVATIVVYVGFLLPVLAATVVGQRRRVALIGESAKAVRR